MIDTPPELEARHRELLLSRSGDERFRMGLQMFAVARELMLASLRARSAVNLEGRAFLRLYGSEVSEEEGTRVLEALRKRREMRS